MHSTRTGHHCSAGTERRARRPPTPPFGSKLSDTTASTRARALNFTCFIFVSRQRQSCTLSVSNNYLYSPLHRFIPHNTYGTPSTLVLRPSTLNRGKNRYKNKGILASCTGFKSIAPASKIFTVGRRRILHSVHLSCRGFKPNGQEEIREHLRYRQIQSSEVCHRALRPSRRSLHVTRFSSGLHQKP